MIDPSKMKPGRGRADVDVVVDGVLLRAPGTLGIGR